MMIIENKYDLKQEVYLTTDDEQRKRIVTAITIRQTGIVYELSCGASASSHYDFEISDTENIEMKVR